MTWKTQKMWKNAEGVEEAEGLGRDMVTSCWLSEERNVVSFHCSCLWKRKYYFNQYNYILVWDHNLDTDKCWFTEIYSWNLLHEEVSSNRVLCGPTCPKPLKFLCPTYASSSVTA
jgi:hypothetical protein